MGNRVIKLMTLSVFLFMLFSSTVAYSASNANANILPAQLPSPPVQPFSSKVITMYVYESGNVLYEFDDFLLTPNLTYFDLLNDEEVFNNTYAISFALNPTLTSNQAEIYVLYFDDHHADSAYIDYAQTVRQKIIESLSDVGLTLIKTGEENAYYQTYNLTIMHWTYNIENSSSIFQVMYEFTYNAFDQYFSPFIKLSDDWEMDYYALTFFREEVGADMKAAVTMESKLSYAFSGNGTHTFSFKELTGMEKLPLVNNSDYYVQISLPPEATIDLDSIDVGTADYQVDTESGIIIVAIHNDSSIQDIKFNFTYDFTSPPPEEETEQPGGEGSEENSGIQLSTTVLYIIGFVTVAIIAVGVVVAKKVLS